MITLLFTALLILVPVAANASFTVEFPGIVDLHVGVEGHVTTLSDLEGFDIAETFDLAGTGGFRGFYESPLMLFDLSEEVTFETSGAGGVTATGRISEFQSEAFPVHFSSSSIELVTPLWTLVFFADPFGGSVIGGLTGAFFEGRSGGFPDGELFQITVGGEGGTFVGSIVFPGAVTRIPEPGVMFLMLAATLLMTTTAVFRRIN